MSDIRSYEGPDPKSLSDTDLAAHIQREFRVRDWWPGMDSYDSARGETVPHPLIKEAAKRLRGVPVEQLAEAFGPDGMIDCLPCPSCMESCPQCGSGNQNVMSLGCHDRIHKWHYNGTRHALAAPTPWSWRWQGSNVPGMDDCGCVVIVDADGADVAYLGDTEDNDVPLAERIIAAVNSHANPPNPKENKLETPTGVEIDVTPRIGGPAQTTTGTFDVLHIPYSPSDDLTPENYGIPNDAVIVSRTALERLVFERKELHRRATEFTKALRFLDGPVRQPDNGATT